jgi:hypothetical protein
VAAPADVREQRAGHPQDAARGADQQQRSAALGQARQVGAHGGAGGEGRQQVAGPAPRLDQATEVEQHPQVEADVHEVAVDEGVREVTPPGVGQREAGDADDEGPGDRARRDAVTADDEGPGRGVEQRLAHERQRDHGRRGRRRAGATGRPHRVGSGRPAASSARRCGARRAGAATR